MYIPKKIIWNDKYATGEASLDFQHRYLMETCNKLGEMIASGFEMEGVRLIVGRLRFYSEWHFAKEEKCIEHYQCPAADTNKRAHEAFMKVVKDYQQQFNGDGGTPELAMKMHLDLLDWLEYHILNVDTHLYECIYKTEAEERTAEVPPD